MPAFSYAVDTSDRHTFVVTADQDMANGRAAIASLERKGSAASEDAKAKIDADCIAIQSDVKSVEAKLSALKHASAARWKEFEADVGAATARLRKSVEKVVT